MFFVILKEISDYFFEYGRQAAFFAAYCCAMVCIFYGFRISRQKKRAAFSFYFLVRAVVFYLFFFYIYMVFAITFHSRLESDTQVLNFEFFSTFRNTFHHKKFICENILMFVPYAVFLYILIKPCRKIYASILVGAGTSLCIEILQYVTHLGRFEVDDLLTNTFGMLTGYLVCSVTHVICRKMVK